MRSPPPVLNQSPPTSRALRIHFLAPDEPLLTLSVFRERLFLLELVYHSKCDVFGAPLELICYACLAIKPLSEFRAEQTRGVKDNGGCEALQRVCLACEV